MTKELIDRFQLEETELIAPVSGSWWSSKSLPGLERLFFAETDRPGMYYVWTVIAIGKRMWQSEQTLSETLLLSDSGLLFISSSAAPTGKELLKALS